MLVHQTHEEKQRRWQSYWERRNDGPIVRMTIPRPGVEPQEPPAYLEAFDGGEKFQQVADKLARWYENHRFLADAIPYYALSFGSDDFAAYLGADLKLAPDGTTS